MANTWKQPRCPPVDEWIKQLWDIYTMEYYLAIKKREIFSPVTVWMDVKSIMQSEITQSEIHLYMESNEKIN